MILVQINLKYKTYRSLDKNETGVIIAVSTYGGSGLSDLPGCVQDAKLIQTILDAQDGYEEILLLTTKTNSVEVKQHLIDS